MSLGARARARRARARWQGSPRPRPTYPDGRALGYDYDNQGNRTKLTAILTAASLVSSYTFDPLNRLETVTDPAGRAYTHAYDDNGNRASLVHPNGVETAYTYDPLNRLTSLASTHPGLARTIQTYAFTLGPAGNRTRILEAQGLPQERSLDYTYDALYRLTGETVTEPLGLAYAKTFAYDPVGNRLTQTTALGPAGSPGPHLQDGTLAYGYDTRDRLETEQLDALPATAYAWDANGNLTSKDAEATYTWDHENRLIRVTKTDGTLVEHLYDVDGNRVRTSVTPPAGPTTTTHFLVDTSGGLSHVVAETDGTATLQAYYIRGDDLLAVMRPLVPAPATATDWQTRYFHADGLGSIRRLTDEAATITDGYTYSAFGELLAHSGTDPQPYAFAGEPLDPNSGWQYHRARWMDPAVGRFVGVDPWDGSPFEPLSLHRYIYANANPVGAFDPTGEFTLSVQTVTAGLISALSAGISNAALSAVFTGVSGEEITASQLRDAFLIGAITAPIGGLLTRAFAPLLKASLEPFLIAVGSMRRVTLVGTRTVWERFLVKASRIFVNTNVKYPPVTGTPLGRVLKRYVTGIEWQQHHIFVQQAWTRVGSSHQLYDNLVANEGLRRIGNGLWNLIPIPASINNWLGRSPIAAQMIASIYYSVIVYGPGHVVAGFTE